MQHVRPITFRNALASLAVLLCALVGVFASASASAGAASLLGVACLSVSQCTAIDGEGRELTFNPGAPGTPAPTAIDGASVPRAVACPSVSQCTVVDGAGREVTFDPAAPGNPTPMVIDSAGGLGTLACPSVSQCTAVDGGGREVTFDPAAPGNPTAVRVDEPETRSTSIGTMRYTTDVSGLACASISQCTAVDTAGREVTFDPTDPGTPTGVVVDQPYLIGMMEGYSALTGVTCVSSAQCTAVDSAGREVTFDPTAPGNPTPTSVTVDPVFFGGLEGVACPTASQCTAVEQGDREVTFDPNAPGNPTPAPLDVVPLDAVACPSAAQCTAVDSSGGEVTFNPAFPASAIRVAIDSSGSTTTTTTTTTTTVSSGIAQAAGSARVRRGVATIELTCTGSGGCTGTVRLLARVVGKRTVSRRGRPRTIRRARTIVIGEANFSLAKGASTLVRVHLSSQGKKLVLSSGKRGLIVTISGTAIDNGTLLLEKPKS